MNRNVVCKIIKLNSEGWDEILDNFLDSNLYQTEAFVKNSIGGENTEQFIVFLNDKVIGATQVRLKVIPKLNRGIAYVRWGPLWKTSNDVDPNKFELVLNKLQEEYVKKRKLVLRVVSNEISNGKLNFNQLFEKFGFNSIDSSSKTIIIDISNDEETLRKNFRKKWRYSLKQAEKKDLSVKIGSDKESFNTFLTIYKEMHNRKKFDEFVNVETFRQINEELSDANKMQVFICSFEGEPVSAMVTTAMGNKGIYLLGGTTEKGLKLSSSYLLQWEVIKWLKKSGKTYYDLGGIDKEVNPGVYTFKSGMGGEEVDFAGSFEAGKDLISKKIVQLGELLKR